MLSALGRLWVAQQKHTGTTQRVFRTLMTLNMVVEQHTTTTPLVTRLATTQEPIRRVHDSYTPTLRYQVSLVAEEDAPTVEEDTDRTDEDSIVDTAQFIPADDH